MHAENALYLLEDRHRGFGIEVDNCEESYFLLRDGGYVDFDGDRHFITDEGIHYVDRAGRFQYGRICWPTHDELLGSDKWLPISLKDFIEACDGGGEVFEDVSLERVLGL